MEAISYLIKQINGTKKLNKNIFDLIIYIWNEILLNIISTINVELLLENIKSYLIYKSKESIKEMKNKLSYSAFTMLSACLHVIKVNKQQKYDINGKWTNKNVVFLTNSNYLQINYWMMYKTSNLKWNISLTIWNDEYECDR